jgi:hypothetical protein
MAPGTQLPAPLRLMLGLMITPGVGSIMSRMVKPSTKSVVKMMGYFGEGQTVLNYPEQIEAQVVAGRDAVVARANIGELVASFVREPDSSGRSLWNLTQRPSSTLRLRARGGWA